MQVIDPTTVTPLKGTPILPVAPVPTSSVTPVGTAEKKGNGQGARQQLGNSGARFRATLDAATVAGLGHISGDTPAVTESTAPFEGTTPSRIPPASQELNAADTPELYRAARAYAAGTAASQTESVAASAPTAQAGPTVRQQALIAATRYAQSFFSVGGTFAARGDTLELSA